VPWLRRLVAGLSLQRPGFAPPSIHVGFMVDKLGLLWLCTFFTNRGFSINKLICVSINTCVFYNYVELWIILHISVSTILYPFYISRDISITICPLSSIFLVSLYTGYIYNPEIIFRLSVCYFLSHCNFSITLYFFCSILLCTYIFFTFPTSA
jgi:hypothetical protein